MIARGSSRLMTSVSWGPAKAVLSSIAFAPSLASATMASTKPRWLRHITPTPSPSRTPSSASALARRLERSLSSLKLSVPRSSMTASASGYSAAAAAKPPAGVKPQRVMAASARGGRSGRTGRTSRARLKTAAACTLWPTRFASDASRSSGLSPPLSLTRCQYHEPVGATRATFQDPARGYVSGMKAVVTGATGFLGGHVSRLLCERGDEVRVTYRNPERLKHLKGLDVRRAKADVLDFKAMRRAMKGYDLLFHTVGFVGSSPAELVWRMKAHPPVVAVEAAAAEGLKRVVLTSTISAIGPATNGQPANELTDYPRDWLGLAYPDSKHEGEIAAVDAGERPEIQGVVVKPPYLP